MTPIVDARWRQHVTIEGGVRSMRIVPRGASPSLELVVVDDGGAVSVVFLGRRQMAGIDVGSRIRATGTVGAHKGRLTMLNPSYEILER